MDKQTKQRRKLLNKLQDKEPVKIITVLYWLLTLTLVFGVVGWGLGFYEFLFIK